MADPDSTSGPGNGERPPDQTGVAAFGDWQTWFRVTGKLNGLCVPVVVVSDLGTPHDSSLGLAALADPDRVARPVVHYDQVGCGHSSGRPDGAAEFWTEDLYQAELENLVAYLGIDGGYHLLGIGAGGLLAAYHAAHRTPGLRKLVLVNAPVSTASYSSPVDLPDLDVTDRLGDIAVPTLVVTGGPSRQPEDATDAYLERIRGVRWRDFDDDERLSTLEDRPEYLDQLSEFLSSKGSAHLRLV